MTFPQVAEAFQIFPFYLLSSRGKEREKRQLATWPAPEGGRSLPDFHFCCRVLFPRFFPSSFFFSWVLLLRLFCRFSFLFLYFWENLGFRLCPSLSFVPSFVLSQEAAPTIRLFSSFPSFPPQPQFPPFLRCRKRNDALLGFSFPSSSSTFLFLLPPPSAGEEEGGEDEKP